MSGFRLGRLLGITIWVELDWFIGSSMMLAAFALVVFPLSLPAAPWPLQVLLAGVVTLVFYVSLLVHEFAHAVVARRYGLPVQSIALHIFGGVAHLRGEPGSPREEVVITGAGPVISAGLAVGFGGAAVGAVEIGGSPALVIGLRSLAVLNAFVALFNLLPVFPLDGGRLLRALLWRLTGSLDQATRIVIRVSTTASYLLIGLGVWRLIAVDASHGLATIILGVALQQTAAGRYRQFVLRSALKGVSAVDIMSPLGEPVMADLTLEQLFSEHFRKAGSQTRAVQGDRGSAEPAGLITRQQLERIPPEEWPARSVGDTMTPWSELGSVRPRDEMARVMDVLRESAGDHVLVRSKDRILGIITATDVAAWLERGRSDR